MTSIPKMRTLDNAIKEIKEVDPDTQLTRHALRRMMLNGTIPCVNLGRKRLVDLNLVWNYLAYPIPASAPLTVSSGIRKIS